MSVLGLGVLELREISARMKTVASVARLPLGSGQWSGVMGSVLGQGTGSSVDFHDQRVYHPGDDPRHINWQAYARSGNYMMKLYRQEVTPRVDVWFDGSASMFLNEEKAKRSLELLYFCVESGMRQGASVKVYVVGGFGVKELEIERLLAGELELDEQDMNEVKMRERAVVMAEVPLRAGALRLWISDVLYEEAPFGVLSFLTRDKGRGAVLVPTSVDESNPGWDGNVEFEDCESGVVERRRVEEEVLRRYEEAYARHFELWRVECMRRGVAFGRVPSEEEMLRALGVEAMKAGIVLGE